MSDLSTPTPPPAATHWPFKDAATAAEYNRLRMSGYALIRQAHELFQQAIKELK